MTKSEPRLSWYDLASAAVGGIVLLVFSRCVLCDFVDWDDNAYVYENPVILSGLSAESFRRVCTDTFLYTWAPVQMISYLVDATIFGMRPWGFHLTNVSIHAVSAALLARTLTLVTGHAGRSVVAAILWAVHPMRVESVAWISDRKDVLAGFFLIVALAAYGRHARNPRLGSLVAVAAAMATSVLSKASAMTVPVLFLLFDIWPLGRVEFLRPRISFDVSGQVPPFRVQSPLWLLIEKLPLFAISFVIAVVTMRTHTIDVTHPAMSTAIERIFLLRHNLLWYAKTTLWPAGLHPMHIPGEDIVGMPVGMYAAMALAAIGIVATPQGRAASRSAAPAAVFGIGWFLVASLPTIGLTTQVGVSPYADRYTYVPHIGLAIAAAWFCGTLIDRIPSLRGWAIAAVGSVIGSWIIFDFQQIQVWQNSRTLVARVLSVDPDNFIALTRAGGYARQNRDLATAEKQFQRAIAASVSGYSPAIIGLAHTYECSGRTQEAATIYRWAARVGRDPTQAAALAALARDCDGKSQLRIPAPITKPAGSVIPDAIAAMKAGMASVRCGEFKNAMAAFRNAVALDPKYAAAHNNLGMAAVELGDRRAALEAFENAVVCDATQPDYAVNLARTYALLERNRDALSAIEAAARLAPGDPEIKVLLDDYRRRANE